MDLFLTLFIAFIAAPLVLGPFVVKLTHWVSANITITPVAPEALDRTVRDFIDSARTGFEALGFDLVGYFHLSNYTPKVASFFGLFTNERRRIAGMAVVIRSGAGGTVGYCEFTTKYADGRTVNVNNSPVMGSYKKPDTRTYRYPDVSDLRLLAAINDWVISHDRRAGNAVGPAKGRELDALREALESEMRQQARHGCYVVDESRTRYRPTWKGALVLTAKNAFPIKMVRGLLDLAGRETGRRRNVDDDVRLMRCAVAGDDGVRRDPLDTFGDQ